MRVSFKNFWGIYSDITHQHQSSYKTSKVLRSIENAYKNLPHQCRSTIDSPWDTERTWGGAFLTCWRSLCRCRADRAMPSHDQKINLTGFPMNSSSPKTEDSWAPLHSSHIYFIQRIMVVAKIFSTGDEGLMVCTHSFFSQEPLPDNNTALFSPSVYAKRGGLPWSTTSIQHISGDSQRTTSSPFLAYSPTRNPRQNCRQPLSRQTRTGLKSQFTYSPRGRPLSPPYFTSL